MKQEFEKFVCELARVEYKVIAVLVDENDRKIYTKITYGMLHQAKDAINRKAYNEGTKGHYHIRQGLALFIVSYGNCTVSGFSEESFIYCDHNDSEQQALAAALKYVMENKK